MTVKGLRRLFLCALLLSGCAAPADPPTKLAKEPESQQRPRSAQPYFEKEWTGVLRTEKGEEAYCRLSLGPLLRGRVRLHIRWETPSCVYRELADGEWDDLARTGLEAGVISCWVNPPLSLTDQDRAPCFSQVYVLEFAPDYQAVDVRTQRGDCVAFVDATPPR